jgi:hypothetical protein
MRPFLVLDDVAEATAAVSAATETATSTACFICDPRFELTREACGAGICGG